MPRTLMFIDSPELYDTIFHFNNYARECDPLRSLIDEVVPGARTILDVACGTGEHAKFLKHHYAVDGIDINERYLRAARGEEPLVGLPASGRRLARFSGIQSARIGPPAGACPARSFAATPPGSTASSQASHCEPSQPS